MPPVHSHQELVKRLQQAADHAKVLQQNAQEAQAAAAHLGVTDPPHVPGSQGSSNGKTAPSG